MGEKGEKKIGTTVIAWSIKYTLKKRIGKPNLQVIPANYYMSNAYRLNLDIKRESKTKNIR